MVIFQKFLTSFTSILTFLSFSYSERFLYTQEHIGAICLFFFRKFFISFTCFFLMLFFVFLIIFIYHFYIQKRSFINFLNFLHNFLIRIFFISVFFIRTFFTRIFFIRIFSIRIRRNFYTSIIYLGIFFSLTAYLPSIKKLGKNIF